MRVVPLLIAAVVVLVLSGSLGVARPAKAFDPTTAPEIQDRLLSGLVDYELRPTGEQKASTIPRSFQPNNNNGCGLKDATNIKVNQNCLNLSDPSLQGRGQAENETAIAVDPQDPKNVIASYNDYRRGDGNCYTSFSSDGGKSWTDSTPPMGFTDGTPYGAARQYWQAGGDTSVAWDTQGNGYLACQMFMRGKPSSPNPDLSSAVFLFRSTGTDGASWNFPARPAVQFADVTGSCAGACLIDKPYMTVDNHTGSPFQDRIYVTYTDFASNGTAYIYEVHSDNYGESFSSPVLVSASTSTCTNTFGLPTPNGTCNENQFSDPFTGSDGALYVAYANFNNSVTGKDNRNQMLLAKSTDGGASFGPPVKVGDYYDLPDCNTYQGAGADPFRACVPEKGTGTRSIFRATNYPSGAVDPGNPSRVVVTYGSYINKYSKESNGCTPDGFASNGDNTFTGVKTAGACNNKILYSVSTDGGATFTGGATGADPRTQTTLNTAQQAGTDQFWQWASWSSNGSLAVSYYDRQYGDDETTGNLDFTLSGSNNLSTWGQTRVTTSSMPPPTEFSGQFLGDYTGLDTSGNLALPIWADTRAIDLFLCPNTGTPGTPPQTCEGIETGGQQDGMLANDEDVFDSWVPIPSH